MAEHNPFLRPTINLHAPGGLDELLALHKRVFGGWQMFGPPAPVGPAADPVTPPAVPTSPPAPATPPAAPPAPAADPGFPANTPVEQMTAPQREAYYKNQAQKWQGRAENNYSALRNLGVTKPEDVAVAKEKITKHDALEQELMSDKDKAVHAAKTDTQTAADAHYRPLLVKAEFKAAAAGKIDGERLSTILEPLDLSKFLTESGDVDANKIASYVEGLQPGKGNSTRQAGPTVFGLGQQPQQHAAAGERGKAMAAKRFKTTQKS